MNISLRRAAALQNSIQECLRGIALEYKVHLNEFQDAESVIAASQLQLADNLARRQKLIDVLYHIRDQISGANHESGIDQRLTALARLDRLIQDHQALAAAEPRRPSAVIEGLLAKMRATGVEHRVYDPEGSIHSSIMRDSDIQQHRRRVQELRRERQRIHDEVLELNVRTEIALDPVAVQVLRQQDLL